MMEIIVVYEFDRAPAVSGRASVGEGAQVVRQVHATPAAPGSSAPGPRTFCGKDSFAMEAASWKPSEHPGSSWYAPEYADRVCSACDAVLEDEA
ncbi:MULTISPECIES: hypothetical protein [Streptomyces]|uniref:Uncharacterized protein n=1 Tax=Streptomyces nondiastaticus TaxID=3154512 RepID=A0ABW6U365_9ACTN|nr:hypothetical protein [Streptomyces sp. VNUA116]WKU42848.1 hypothetical protein Q3V23_01515 [Streptomyces sp. VNUA116]